MAEVTSEPDLPRRSAIQAIDRASVMLEAVAGAGPGGLGLTEIAQHAGLPASTARTLLSSLVVHTFIAQHPQSRRYVLGPRTFELNRLYNAQIDLASIAAPLLRELWERTRETVHLAVLQGGRRLDLAVLVSPQLLNVNPTVSPQYASASADDTRVFDSLLTTAAGKVLLAWAGEEALDAVLTATGAGRAPARRRHAQQLLAEVRRHGHAVNNEEEEVGVCGIAAPVRDVTGVVCAAVCVGYPAVRRTPDHEKQLLAATRASASAVSAALGAEPGDTRTGDARTGDSGAA